MEKRKFGKTDMQVGVIGFGGSEIGFGDATQSEIDLILNESLDAGLNVVDTGECYKDSEEKIGKAISHRRDEFYLFTKTGHASGFPEEDWDPKMMAKQIDRSLSRLKTDRLDLIQLHSCTLDLLRQGDVIEVVRRAKEAGKARFIGYSGDNQEAEYAVLCGAFDSLQCSFSIADMANGEAIEMADVAGMGVIAKRPIANAAWIKQYNESQYGFDYLQRLDKLDYPFLKLDPAKSIATALRFTLAQPGICTAIVGISKPGRYSENLAAYEETSLTQDDVRAIRNRWQEVREDWEGRG